MILNIWSGTRSSRDIGIFHYDDVIMGAIASNHQPHHCLLNRLFRRRSKTTSKLRVTGLCVGNSPGPVNFPHKWPVTRKMFPFDDVIMQQDRRWNADKPSATLDPYIPTWLTTSPANHRPANFWFFFFFTFKGICEKWCNLRSNWWASTSNLKFPFSDSFKYK